MAEEKRLQVYQCPCCLEDGDSDTGITPEQFDTDEAEYKVHRDKCDWRGQVVEFQGHSIQEQCGISSDKMRGKFKKDVGNKMRKMDDMVTSGSLEAQQMLQFNRQTQELKRMEEQKKKDRERIEAMQRKIRAQDRIIALKDVALAEQDRRIQALEQASYDGILVWKIKDFAKKRTRRTLWKPPIIRLPLLLYKSPWLQDVCQDLSEW
ncbi:uncharacterized protein [Ptychodera flava]|uniref:uncharacterized protein n=1 Tax=Ptychodera flava TaxID=63121 RepID=UPI00396A92D4